MVRLKRRWLLLQVMEQEGDTRNNNYNSRNRKDKGKEKQHEVLEAGQHDVLLLVNNNFHSSSSAPSSFSAKDMTLAIRRNVEESFGLQGEVFSFEIQVRFWDEKHTQLMLLRMSRDVVRPVRASLTMLTSIGIEPRRVSFSTLSVHGSTRTAKLAAMRAVRNYYRDRIVSIRRQQSQHQRSSRKSSSTSTRDKQEQRKHNKVSTASQRHSEVSEDLLCATMEQTLLTLQQIDF